MTTTVRPVSLADKERWLELFKAYIVFYESELSDEQFELTWNRIHSDFNMYGLVAEQDGNIVGIANYLYRPSTWAKNDFCYLEDLFVDPAARGTGSGRALIDFVKAYALEMKCSRLYWNTDADNETARKLYDTYVLESGKRQYRVQL